jgi:hypothetical protein
VLWLVLQHAAYVGWPRIDQILRQIDSALDYSKSLVQSPVVAGETRPHVVDTYICMHTYMMDLVNALGTVLRCSYQTDVKLFDP